MRHEFLRSGLQEDPPSLCCLTLKREKLSCSETSVNYSPFDTASHSTRPVPSSCPTVRKLVQVSVCNHFTSYVSGVEQILGSRWPWGINCVQRRTILWESSVWNFPNATLRALRIFKWLLNYWKICVPCATGTCLSTDMNVAFKNNRKKYSTHYLCLEEYSVLKHVLHFNHFSIIFVTEQFYITII